MTIRGILFDIDDTLIDYAASARTAVVGHLAAQELLDRFESPETAAALWLALEEELYPRYLAGELTFRGQQLLRTERFLAHIGVTGSDTAGWFDGYATLRDTTWRAFADVAPALGKFSGTVALGVVSNSSLAYQTGKLRAVGLLDHFGEAILCSSEYGAAKPDPSIFHAGCALLGLPPEQVAYVGDRYDVDGLGARDAGLRAHWLDRSKSGSVAEAGVTVIHSLEELIIAAEK
ncbi:HAD family hydrolase [Nocardia sp. 2]|uniref:HAD family hydrolase n=1 Tax=Nocardia acididurans TaxID=2802282 RepID=A0ABS1LZV5_9NOCA|nr:HAD family hydrolase [Nocardia acididurans]MBL1073953.1 HAD family hydrolase [Nocardia acididurans]